MVLKPYYPLVSKFVFRNKTSKWLYIYIERDDSVVGLWNKNKVKYGVYLSIHYYRNIHKNKQHTCLFGIDQKRKQNAVKQKPRIATCQGSTENEFWPAHFRATWPLPRQLCQTTKMTRTRHFGLFNREGKREIEQRGERRRESEWER